MRTLTRTLLSLLMTALLMAALPLPASAAAGATIAFSSSTLTPGDTLTVTVAFSGDTVGAVDASLSYDSKVLQFVSGDGAAGAGGVLRLSTYASSEVSSLRFNLTFKALAAGSCTVTVTDSAVYAWDETVIGNPTAGATVKVTDVSLSQNANLQSLKLSAGTLSPAFSAKTTSYTVTVENRVSSLTISAVPADSGASVSVSGGAALSVGSNKRTITVTAPGGATKVYTITITRKSAPSSTAPPSASATTTTTKAPEEENEPITLTYEGALYTVATDLTAVELPDGYTAAETACGDQTVAAAQSKNGKVQLLWLTPTEGEEPAGTFFVYNAAADLLFPYRPLSTAGGTFLLCPASEAQPDATLTAAEWEIGGQACPVWTFSQPEWADFCVIWAMDPDGETGFFRYDTVKATAQRYIAAAATTTATAAAVTTVPTKTTPTEPTEPTSGWSLFGIPVAWLVAGVLLLVCIALVVLTVIFHRRSLAPPPRH